MLWLYVLLVLVAGMALTLQPVINARIAFHAGHPILGALVSVTVTFLTLLAATLALRQPLPGPRLLSTMPPWLLTSGLIGALFLFVSLLAAPRLGAATLIALLIAGQLTAALLVDHFGWLGMPQRSVGALRLLGAVCLVAGVLLIRRF